MRNTATRATAESDARKGGARAQAYEVYGNLVALVVSEKLRGLPKEEIEDVVSRLWETLFSDGGRRLASFAGRAKYETWISKVALNAARNHLRRPRRLTVSLDGDSGYTLKDILGDGSPQPLQRLLTRELRMKVAAAVRGLPKRYREIVYARFYREWTAAEMAGRFHIAEETVYVRLSRAYRMLGSTLAGYVGPETGRRGAVFPRKGFDHLTAAQYVRLVESMSHPNAAPLPRQVAACSFCLGDLLAGNLLLRLLQGTLVPPSAQFAILSEFRHEKPYPPAPGS